jgi:hypothetical protein
MNRQARINRERKELTMNTDANPITEKSNETASKQKRSTKKGKPTKGAKMVAKATPKKIVKRSRKKSKSPTERRTGTKKATVLELLRRKEGATIAEIAKATDWQNHSIRGFISGTLAKKMSLKIESSKKERDERTYRIAE